MRSFSVAIFGFSLMVGAGAESLPRTMPTWLAPYPGAKAEGGSATGESYSADAKPDEVIEHYRKLFKEAALPFLPNFDGIGTSIRAAARECDLLIKIRESDDGTLTRVNCSPRTPGSTSPLYGTDVGIASPEPPAPEPPKPAADAEPEQKKLAEPPAKEKPAMPQVRS